MTATLEIPPPFEVREMGIEGTAEPFIARVFLGLLDMARSTLSQQDKNDFDERFGVRLIRRLNCGRLWSASGS